ncbi:MAG: DUF4124 domain-containing protein [Xanthomonadales bacterium]|nr:DUF4124 domain-containing protein [Xanthomonadales bacterium]NIX12392.1 DUF4124 domain-containing protein [Xanthomonadales bacterium]
MDHLRNHLRLFLILALLPGAAGPALAEICKWTDGQGVIHFAERCPENVQGTEVTTDAGPSSEQVADAIRRSEELRETRSEHGDERTREDAERTAAARAARSGRQALAQACDDAYRDLSILELALPVYRDEGRELHYNQSLHHHWYEGNRTYLDDAARYAEAERTVEFIGENCGAVRRRGEYIHLFRDAPSLTETLGLLNLVGIAATPPAAQVCAFARRTYTEMQGMSSGLPSDDMRELGALLTARCR